MGLAVVRFWYWLGFNFSCLGLVLFSLCFIIDADLVSVQENLIALNIFSDRIQMNTVERWRGMMFPLVLNILTL